MLILYVLTYTLIEVDLITRTCISDTTQGTKGLNLGVGIVLMPKSDE